jgi:hypothetical protein
MPPKQSNEPEMPDLPEVDPPAYVVAPAAGSAEQSISTEQNQPIHIRELEFVVTADDDAVMVSASNTLTGDMFVRRVSATEIHKGLFEGTVPPTLHTLQGFHTVVIDALKQEAGQPGTPEGVSAQTKQSAEEITITVNFQMGTGYMAMAARATIRVPLKERASTDTRHTLALERMRREMVREKEALAAELDAKFQAELQEMRAEMATLKELVHALVTLPQLSPRIQFGMNASASGTHKQTSIVDNAASRGLHRALHHLVDELKLSVQGTTVHFGDVAVVPVPSCLHLAILNMDLQDTTYLLDRGARLEEARPIGFDAKSRAMSYTPLQTAAQVVSLEIVQLLVDRGAITHTSEFTVPKGQKGDLVAGYLQQHGSKPVKRV